MAEIPSRKLAVLLHADVVGSTALVRLDETVAHERMQNAFRRLAEVIAIHGGIAHEIRGDALVAEFSKASDAISAAIAFQSANSDHNERLSDDIRPVVRVGIALGEVVIADGTITGEGIVLAQRLEQLAEPGGACIHDAAYQTVPKRLPFTFENMGEQQLKGFDELVRAYAVRPGPPASPSDLVASSERSVDKLESPDKPSIAVLPFTNMSGDAEQEFFSDGITEDIITELSRFSMFVVIARNSSFAFKGKSVDIKEIGLSLGVDYILEGSVRKSGHRVRVTAQLIEADTGNHLWADRYDRELEDIFAVQDEVAQTIVSMLAVRMEEDALELSKRKPPRDLRAYDLWLRGNRSLDLWTAEGNTEAIELFERAIALDSTFARAHAGLAAACQWTTSYTAWNTSNRDMNAAALAHARRAVELDDTDYQPHVVLAWVHHMRREYEQSRRHLDVALARNPNDADNLAHRSILLTTAGEPELGRVCAEAAIRLNPFHGDFYLCFLGASLFFLDRYEEAIAAFSQAPDGLPEVRALVAAAYALTQRLDEAQEIIQAFIANYSLNWVGEPNAETIVGLFSFKLERDADLLLRGLRAAGMD